MFEVTPAAGDVVPDVCERECADDPQGTVLGEQIGEQIRRRQAEIADASQSMPFDVPREVYGREDEQETTDYAEGDLNESTRDTQYVEPEDEEQAEVEEQDEYSEPASPSSFHSARGCSNDRRFHALLLAD